MSWPSTPGSCQHVDLSGTCSWVPCDGGTSHHPSSNSGLRGALSGRRAPRCSQLTSTLGQEPLHVSWALFPTFGALGLSAHLLGTVPVYGASVSGPEGPHRQNCQILQTQWTGLVRTECPVLGQSPGAVGLGSEQLDSLTQIPAEQEFSHVLIADATHQGHLRNRVSPPCLELAWPRLGGQEEVTKCLWNAKRPWERPEQRRSGWAREGCDFGETDCGRQGLRLREGADKHQDSQGT